ncbi:MAG: hypothetical protein P1U63_03500 [Coxiellaceae bacterium]|nr:hypothetical protein [Coxiellaceae bacterium]
MSKITLIVSILALSLPLTCFSASTNSTSKKTTSTQSENTVPAQPMLHRSIQNKQEQCQLQCPYVAPTATGPIGKSQADTNRQNCMDRCLARP